MYQESCSIHRIGKLVLDDTLTTRYLEKLMNVFVTTKSDYKGLDRHWRLGSLQLLYANEAKL